MSTDRTNREAASQAARALRMVNSERQQAAARENGKKGSRPRRELDAYPCTCGGCESGASKWTCPRGRNILMRQKREREAAERQASEQAAAGAERQD